MAELSDPWSSPRTHLFETPLSDSEPELDIDAVPAPPPIFEPIFIEEDGTHNFNNHPHYYYFNPHYNPEVSSQNNLVHRNSSETGPNSGHASGPVLGLGLGDQRCAISGERERLGGGSKEVDLELGLGLGSTSRPTSETSSFGGLRVVNVDSDTDSEDGFWGNVDEIDNRFGGVSDFDRPPFCWDYLGFNSNRTQNDVNSNNNNDEVNEMENDGDVGENEDDFFYGGGPSVVDEIDVDAEADVDVDADVSILFDTYQEREEQREIIRIESDDDEGVEGEDFGVDDAIRDLEWEILLAVNNFNREVYDMDFNVDMYEAILGEVEERMNEWRGSPPAGDAVIESLPSVRVLNEGGLKENEVVCAICKDEVSAEELVRQLPCLHYYHGDCIVPWLKMRNTCPVCRFELPTDDAEYEYRKRESEVVDADANDELSLDSQVSYDYHVFF